MLAQTTPCGPDLDPIVDAVRLARNAGIDHVYLHQLGPDQEGCLDLWDAELGDRTAALRHDPSLEASSGEAPPHDAGPKRFR